MPDPTPTPRDCLSASELEAVRGLVAARQSLPPSLARRLLHDHDEWIRRAFEGAGYAVK